MPKRGYAKKRENLKGKKKREKKHTRFKAPLLDVKLACACVVALTVIIVCVGAGQV